VSASRSLQMYKKMLSELQFEQINVTREYQKLFAEKEVWETGVAVGTFGPIALL
jgi:hypothetical protein